MNSYYVYILTNKNNTVLYIGMTNEIHRRIKEHKAGALDGFSKRYKTHKLVYYEKTNDVNSAIMREKNLKGWSRKKKEELINGINPEWNDLSEDPLFITV